MPKVGHLVSRLFALPEYERAQFDTFFSAVRVLMRSKDSLYADIPEGGSSEVVPTTQNTMPSGQIVKTEPVCIESKIAFKWDDIRNCNLEAIAEQANKAADEQLAIIEPRLF